MADAKINEAGLALIDRLRTQGWSVAVHNDYRLEGQVHTFWLLTHPSGIWVKGEGTTDAEALQQCAEAALAQASEPGVKALEWKHYPENNIGGEEWVASGVCEYHALVTVNGAHFRLIYPASAAHLFETLEAAKAVAQADYEQCIRSAFAAAPPAPVVDAGEKVVAWQPHVDGHPYKDDGDDHPVVAAAERDYDHLVGLLPERRRAVDYLIGVASRASPSDAGEKVQPVATKQSIAVRWQKAEADRRVNPYLPDFSLPASEFPDYRTGGGNTFVPPGYAQKCIRQDCDCPDMWNCSRPPIKAALALKQQGTET